MALQVSPIQGSGTTGSTTGGRADLLLQGIYEISKTLSMPGARFELVLSHVLNVLSSYLDMHNGLIALLDRGGAPEIVVGAGWSEATAKHYFERLPERAVGQIIVTKMPLVVQNVSVDPLFAQWNPAEATADEPEAAVTGLSYSFIGVPIKIRDEVVGTLTIDREWDERPYFRFDEDVRFLTMVANLIGQTVRLHRLLVHDRERLITEQHRLEKALQSGVGEVVAPAHGAPKTGAGRIIGESAAIRTVLDKIRIVARSHSTVVLRGESGTGKELFANTLHDLSPRRSGPFVKLNCAALAESVLESELFGHEKGAFTGASAQRKGRFEMADGGTLFLDEIGEISLAFQAKLLRVLQEGEFERVGGNRTMKVDVRLVVATNRNLEEAVAKGDFRADLYYRLGVVQIFLPPLRDRPGDVQLLAQEFLDRFNRENGTDLALGDAALHVLGACYFPGNVRELENCVWRTATFAQGAQIVERDFACHNDGCLSSVLWKGHTDMPPGFTPLPIVTPVPPPAPAARAPAPTAESPVAAEPQGCPAPGNCPVPHGDGRSERERLIEAMEVSGWVQAKAARVLGLTPRQIGYALRKHNIPIKRF
jgi:Nif-specific regulatory protein